MGGKTFHKVVVHGHHLTGDEDVLFYLRHLSSQEADVLFDRARMYGHVEFEFNDLDHHRYDAVMKKDGEGGYLVEVS